MRRAYDVIPMLHFRFRRFRIVRARFRCFFFRIDSLWFFLFRILTFQFVTLALRKLYFQDVFEKRLKNSKFDNKNLSKYAGNSYLFHSKVIHMYKTSIIRFTNNESMRVIFADLQLSSFFVALQHKDLKFKVCDIFNLTHRQFLSVSTYFRKSCILRTKNVHYKRGKLGNDFSFQPCIILWT